MGFIYLASPYSHENETVRRERFEAVSKYAANMIEQGVIVYSPISHTHPMFIYGNVGTMGFDYWQKVDKLFIDLCDKMCVLKLTGWEESKGIQAEMEYALRIGKKVEFLEE